MPAYAIRLYDHLEFVVRASTELKAREKASDLTDEDWNEIDAEKIVLPGDATIEEYCRTNRVEVLE